jgi:hypothetical protein
LGSCRMGCLFSGTLSHKDLVSHGPCHRDRVRDRVRGPRHGVLVTRARGRRHRNLVAGILSRDAAIAFLSRGRVTVFVEGPCRGALSRVLVTGPCHGTLSEGPCYRDLAIGTLPQGPCHRDLAIVSLPRGPCHGDLARGTLPEGPCQRDLVLGTCNGGLVLGPCATS